MGVGVRSWIYYYLLVFFNFIRAVLFPIINLSLSILKCFHMQA